MSRVYSYLWQQKNSGITRVLAGKLSRTRGLTEHKPFDGSQMGNRREATKRALAQALEPD
jgi:hypothetical protein